MHKPALVSALVSDNDGNRRRNLLGSNVESRRVQRQIAVEVPANPNVTELKRGCDAATHLSSRAIGERWEGRFSWLLFLLHFFCDRLRCWCRLDLACTAKKRHKHQK